MPITTPISVLPLNQKLKLTVVGDTMWRSEAKNLTLSRFDQMLLDKMLFDQMFFDQMLLDRFDQMLFDQV